MDALQLVSDRDELEEILAFSRQEPVLVFKHSLFCPISAMAFDAYQRFVAGVGASSGARFALVEIQSAQDVSRAIADRTGVRHESPQALLFRDGEVVWHASHGAITEESLAAALRQHGAGAGQGGGPLDPAPPTSASDGRREPGTSRA